MDNATGLLALSLACAVLDGGFADEPSNPPLPKHRFVTSNPDAQDMWPCFSPDSQTLLFTRTTDRKTWKLFTVSGEWRGAESVPCEVACFRDPRELVGRAQPDRLQWQPA